MVILTEAQTVDVFYCTLLPQFKLLNGRFMATYTLLNHVLNSPSSEKFFDLKHEFRKLTHLLFLLYVKLVCLSSDLCKSFHISEFQVPHVRIQILSRLPYSSGNTEFYILFVCKYEEINIFCLILQIPLG
jgi:hypothetical protein